LKEIEFYLLHPCGIEISSELEELAVESLENLTKRDMETGWVWYDLPIGEIQGVEVHVSLCFKGGVLESISFALKDEQLYGSSWDDWSREKEILRGKDTAEWLKRQGYEIGSHVWGEVWAGFDEKGGSGGGGIRFKR